MDKCKYLAEIKLKKAEIDLKSLELLELQKEQFQIKWIEVTQEDLLKKLKSYPKDHKISICNLRGGNVTNAFINDNGILQFGCFSNNTDYPKTSNVRMFYKEDNSDTFEEKPCWQA